MGRAFRLIHRDGTVLGNRLRHEQELIKKADEEAEQRRKAEFNSPENVAARKALAARWQK